MTHTDHFYNICSQSLESAKAGQYNADNGYPNGFTPADLRKNLEDQAVSFDTNWGASSETPFTMISPGIDVMKSYIDEAVGYYQGWLDAKAGK